MTLCIPHGEGHDRRGHASAKRANGMTGRLCALLLLLLLLLLASATVSQLAMASSATDTNTAKPSTTLAIQKGYVRASQGLDTTTKEVLDTPEDPDTTTSTTTTTTTAAPTTNTTAKPD